MKNRNVFCLILSIIFSVTVFAQSEQKAERIVADFIKQVEQNAIETNIELMIFDEDNDLMQTDKGVFLMKKDKFVLQLESVKIFFDGKIQWTYVSTNNEVSITEPTEEELAEINPILILQDYYKKCTIRFSQKEKVVNAHIIELTPNEPSDFDEIIVATDKNDGKPLLIKLTKQDTFSILVKFSDFKQVVNISDNTFVFDKSQYKDVFENDLR